MKLTYRLLWFDDDPDMVQESEESLARIMRDKGFDLKVEAKTDISEEAIAALKSSLEQYNPYDMIIFDYDLGSRKGTDIAKTLRGKIFTDMVYYSATPLDELRKAVYEAKVEGVFLINKLSCVDELMLILEDHIKKNCDLNSMRGIVLDAISEIEVLLRKDLIHVLHCDSGNLRSTRLKSLQARLRAKGKELNKQAESMSELASNMNAERMLEHFADPVKSDFNTIRQMLHACKEDWENLGEKGLLHRLQSLRNVFAHESYVWDQRNNCVIVRVNGEQKHFDAHVFENIRKELLLMMDEIKTNCEHDVGSL